MPTIAKVSGMCRETLKLKAACVTFIDVERVEQTKNAAERAIRFAVLIRKAASAATAPRAAASSSGSSPRARCCARRSATLYGFLKLMKCSRTHVTPTPSLLPAYLRTGLPTAVAA
jgi:Transposase IS66 family